MSDEQHDLDILLPRALKPRLDRIERAVQKLAHDGRGPLSRREALGLGGMALFLAACGGTTAGGSSSAAPAASSAGGASSAAPTSSLAGKPMEGELVVYDWSDYEDPADYKAFVKANAGLSLKPSYYSDNGEMIAKLNAGGGYDIVVPSQNAAAQLIQQNKLMVFDEALLPNLAGVDPLFRKTEFDPDGTHTATHSYGVTGILYRNDLMSDQPKTLMDFYTLLPKAHKLGRTNMLQGAEEVVPLALMALELDPNSSAQKDLDAAKKLLLAARPYTTTLTSENLEADAGAGKIVFTQAWNGSALNAINQAKKRGKHNLSFVLPTGASERWADSWAIPSNAPHPVAAHAWINFFLKPDVVARTMIYSFYSSPVAAAYPLLPPALASSPYFKIDPTAIKDYRFILNPSPAVVNGRERVYTEFKAA